MRAPLAGGDAGRSLGVEEPGPVEVNLEAEQPGAWEVDVLGPDGGADGLRGDDAVLPGEGAELDTGEHRRCSGLVDEDVGTFVQKHLFSAVRIHLDPDLVGHRS